MFQPSLGQIDVKAVQSVDRETVEPVEELDGIEMVENVLVRRSLVSEETCIRGHCVGCGR